MKQEILRFENVTRQVDGAVYLDNFNFYMTKGEIVGTFTCFKSCKFKNF